mmetsp:Transcript_15841/g.32994  ORF Transcript_15841/g.32994 Transcript_15841/m.32994 type:complete len:83 (-) Transcript_15841:74-322(-)
MLRGATYNFDPIMKSEALPAKYPGLTLDVVGLQGCGWAHLATPAAHPAARPTTILTRILPGPAPPRPPALVTSSQSSAGSAT